MMPVAPILGCFQHFRVEEKHQVKKEQFQVLRIAVFLSTAQSAVQSLLSAEFLSCSLTLVPGET